jgi:glycine betaine catabolism B
VNRSYTIASPPTRVGYCELTVKREERGVSTRHLHDADAVARGACSMSLRRRAVHVHGGRRRDQRDDRGGVGITPLMAKIPYLTDLSWPGEIDLVFAEETEDDIIFRDEFDYLALG